MGNTNTYAINATRGKEFTVETELQALGLHPWVPRRLECKHVKEKRDMVWFEKPYVTKLMFCVIPAIYWPDVVGLKHVIGKPVALSDLDIRGIPKHTKKATGELVEAVPGLADFQRSVEAEYADMQRKKQNGEYQCMYAPGQALRILDGPFEGFPAEYRKLIRQAHDDYAKMRVAVEIFGRETILDIDPDKVVTA